MQNKGSTYHQLSASQTLCTLLDISFTLMSPFSYSQNLKILEVKHTTDTHTYALWHLLLCKSNENSIMLLKQGGHGITTIVSENLVFTYKERGEWSWALDNNTFSSKIKCSFLRMKRHHNPYQKGQDLRLLS